MTIKFMALSLLTAVIGSTGKESTLGGSIAVLGTFVSTYLGDWDTVLKLVVLLMIIDYVTGLAGALKTRTVNSDVMFWDGVRKGIVLLVVVLAVMCDQFVGNSTPIFRTLVLYFYIGREGVSVVENMGTLGVPLPTVLTNFLEQFHQKNEDERERGENRQR
jgi:toxin secretion/phage lysis holin